MGLIGFGIAIGVPIGHLLTVYWPQISRALGVATKVRDISEDEEESE